MTPIDAPQTPAASAMMSGSLVACSERTEVSMWRKMGFSVNVCGVGGLVVLIPIIRRGCGGVVGRKERE